MALSDNLVSYWKLDEASGNALDAHSTNDLTDNNTVSSATGKIGNARDFERDNSETFTRADNAALSTGDIDFTWAAWVQFESKFADEMTIFYKGSAGTGEYNLGYTDNSDRLQFQVWGATGFGSAGTVVANNLGSPSTGTWYFVVVWHDSVNNTLNIQVNNGTADSAAHSAGVIDSTGGLTLGGDSFSNYWDGLIDEVGFWKRVLTSDERTALYNSGAGLSYADIVSGGASASEGTLSETLDGATVAATGSLGITGQAAPTLDDATVSATGQIAIEGELAATLDGATLAAEGTNPNGGEPEPAPVGGFARSKKKPVRRKFVFENGITVWATDERLARLMAGIDARAPESPQEAPEPERAESPAEEPEAAAAPPALESVPVPAVPSEIVIQSLRDRELQRRRDAAMAALARQALEREAAERKQAAAAALAEEQPRAAERAMAARRAIADEEEAIILQLLLLEDA